MNKGHIVWINHFAVAPSEGGGTRHFEIARGLVGAGWRVTIAAADFNLHSRRYGRRTDRSDRAVHEERIDGVELAWLWSAPYSSNNWRRGWNWVSFSRSVARWAASRRFDVVVGSTPHLFAAAAGARLARRARIPFVLEVRDLWPESLVAAGGRRGPLYFALDTLAGRLYRRATRIIVLAQGVAEYLAQRGINPEKFAWIPNGANTSEHDTIARAPRTSNAVTFMYTGAHGPANGLDVVVQAADLLRADHRIRIVLVGDGPAKAQLVADAQERQLRNLEFRDPVPRRMIPHLLKEADAGLLVLRDSPLFTFGVSPNKLFDYLGAALPVVTNVAGDVQRMVLDARAGEQAHDSTPAALADAMRRMCDRSPDDRARLGSAGRAWLDADHSTAALVRKADELFSSLHRS